MPLKKKKHFFLRSTQETENMLTRLFAKRGEERYVDFIYIIDGNFVFFISFYIYVFTNGLMHCFKSQC